MTGASSGIGQATAVECSKMGAVVAITGRSAERLETTFNLLQGDAHMQYRADLMSENDIDSLADQLPELDGCVHCAGISKGVRPISFYKADEMETLFRTNTIAAALLTKSLLKKKKLKRSSSIVFVSSIEGNFKTSIGNGTYGMTKAAISAYARTAALELAPKGIRCNIISPGMVVTPMTAPIGEITEEQLKADMERYPLKRYGDPKDIAWGIIYLLSDASCWVTGSILKIDGGITLI